MEIKEYQSGLVIAVILLATLFQMNSLSAAFAELALKINLSQWTRLPKNIKGREKTNLIKISVIS